MAIRRSTSLINALSQGFGTRELLTDGRLFLYSGSQPASADDAATGTQLLTYTVAGGTYVGPTKAMATIAIGGTATGSIDTLTIGGADFNLLSSSVSFNSSAQQTASDIADNINAKMNFLNITAVANVSDVELYSPYWIGAGANNLTFACTVSGSLTATLSGVFAGGVTAINGLNFADTVNDGLIAKTSDVWQGMGAVTGTAGYFRFVAGGSEPDNTGDTIRFDGSVGTANADMIISSTAVVSEVIYTITAGTITELAE